MWFDVPQAKVKPVWTGFWGRSRALGKVPLAPPVRCPTSKSSTSHRKVRRHIEKFDVTSKGLRRHVEKFDATSKSSMPRRKVRCLTSKRLDAILEYWSVRRFDGRFSPYARFRRLVSKPASAADVGTSNLRRRRARAAVSQTPLRKEYVPHNPTKTAV